MFCPKCKHEFRVGFTVCSNCNIPLIETLPTDTSQMAQNLKYEYNDFELLMATYGFTEIVQIESIFDSEGIVYYIQGENSGAAPGGLPPAVLVKKDQLEKAHQLLREYNML